MNIPTEASPDAFACVLRRFRAELGWTQGVAASYLGISPRAYEYWESGRPERVPNRVCQAGAYYLLSHAAGKTNEI